MILLAGCRKKVHHEPGQPTAAPPLQELRIGYFPNLTHAQAVLGVSSGEFADAVKPAKLTSKVFNAGPSLIEALIAGEIDVGYVGPGPAVNAWDKSQGQAIRVVSGVSANGVLIVAAKDSGINTLQDLVNKRIATPQHGNTQDIACRYYLTHTLRQADSNNVLPIQNAEQTRMMLSGQIDAAWAPEPWGSRLIAEAGAHVIAEEKDLWPRKEFALAVIVASPQFLQDHRDVVKQILAVHRHWTARLREHPDDYVPKLGDALFDLNGQRLPKGVLARAIKNVEFTDDPLPDSIQRMADWAFEMQFLSRRPDLNGLLDPSFAN